jgi:hypothetical protein
MSSDREKWTISIFSGLLFYIIALPQTYECITNPLIKNTIGVELEKKGRPTVIGVIIHAIVFLLIVRYMMDYK